MSSPVASKRSKKESSKVLPVGAERREEEGIKCVCVCVRACVCVRVCANVCECVSSVCVNVRVVYVYV